MTPRIISLLNLPPDADLGTVLARIDALKTQASAPSTGITLGALAAAMTPEQADALVAGAPVTVTIDGQPVTVQTETGAAAAAREADLDGSGFAALVNRISAHEGVAPPPAMPSAHRRRPTTPVDGDQGEGFASLVGRMPL